MNFNTRGKFCGLSLTGSGLGQNKKIMLLDDESDITTVMRRSLEKEGFVVDAYNDPEEAVKAFAPGRYDMVILDIRMPKMSGFDVCKQLRKADGNVMVAFMTAFEIHKEEFQKVFPSMDIKCFFRKPIGMKELVSKLNQELSIAR